MTAQTDENLRLQIATQLLASVLGQSLGREELVTCSTVERVVALASQLIEINQEWARSAVTPSPASSTDRLRIAL